MDPVCRTVIPLRRLPRAISSFTYAVPSGLEQAIAEGSVVRIPFKGSRIFGVVDGLVGQLPAHDRRHLKSIESVSDIQLTRQQIEIARGLARLYYASPATIFASFVPTPPVRSHTVDATASSSRDSAALPSIGPAEIANDAYVLYADYHSAYSYCIEVIRAAPHGSQTAIIVPQRARMFEIATHLRNSLQGAGRCIVLPPRQKKTAYYEAWKAVADAAVVIGPLTALYAPFGRLRQIIVIEAENHMFQSAERNPRYHLADLVELVATRYRAHLLLTGFSPDTTLLYGMRERNHRVLTLGNAVGSFRVIDMQTAPRVRGAPIAEEVLDVLSDSSGQDVVICNRHGDARSQQCRDCEYHAACTSCGTALFIDESGRKLLCASCGFEAAIHLRCPRCDGTNLSFRGYGVSSVARILQNLLPGRSVIQHSSRHEDARDSWPPNVLLVATNKIFSSAQERFESAVFINPDLDLNLPNAHSAESLRHYLKKMKSMSRNVWVQTREPGHYVYATLNSVGDFYAAEIAWRKRFNYPPFGTMYSVSVRESDAGRYADQLQKLTKYFSAIPYFGPFERKSGRYFSASIVIKEPRGAPLPKLDDLLAGAYTGFHIEVNPFELA